MTLTHIANSPYGTTLLSTSQPNPQGQIELYEESPSGLRKLIGAFHPKDLKSRIAQIHARLQSHAPLQATPLKWTPQALAFSGVVPLSQIESTHQNHFQPTEPAQ